MKKSLIAGASVAALAVAAVPFTGVFAAAANPDKITDTLNITIADVCGWTRTLATTASGVTADTNDLTGTMTADQEIAAFGTSTLNVKCNNVKGYGIKATMTGLNGYTDNTKATSLANTYDIAYATTLAAGKWTASYGGNGITSGNTFVNTSASDNMTSGSDYVVTYGVYTAANQPAGFYTGTVEYELTQNT